ncbi:MAG: ornithine carbamoyltransferase [Acidobacteriia bacterium]|nr:ornithine carbamoyltransferase [Terriglobia bacterium]MYG01324.1 ornithine carbamoyltransferase [Terriglobia bacterium]MYK09878.1 ornithine carbamoyltransferase [Terriglobia bacterium]
MNIHSEATARQQRAPVRHFLSDADLSADELREVLDLAASVKADRGRFRRVLQDRSIVMLFEKPSLRTRMTFELAAAQLGGFAVFQDHRDGRIGQREPAPDISRNLDRWFDAIVARTFSQKTLELLAKWSSVPVINALSESFHPCQALADYLTLLERFGSFDGLKLAYVGDANNVAHSLLHCGPQLGVSVSICGPAAYGPRPDDLVKARQVAERNGCTVEVGEDIRQAVQGAAAVYTDVWTSMGWEAETQQRRIAFADYKVDSAVMRLAEKRAVFMHCLPAQRGAEVTNAVIESPQSVVFDQAENRLHAHKAILIKMMEDNHGQAS